MELLISALVPAGPWAPDIFGDVFVPTTVHIPAALLESVDRRAKALGVSRNRRQVFESLGVKTIWVGSFDQVTDVIHAIAAR